MPRRDLQLQSHQPKAETLLLLLFGNFVTSMLLFSAISHLFDTHNTYHEHNNIIARVCSIHHEFRNYDCGHTECVVESLWFRTSLHCCM